MSEEAPDGFNYREHKETHAFIQWKGTDVCMDFRCDCGTEGHIDGYFVHTVKCQGCGTVWQMPHHLFPRKADEHTYQYWRDNPTPLQSEDDC